MAVTRRGSIVSFSGTPEVEEAIREFSEHLKKQLPPGVELNNSIVCRSLVLMGFEAFKQIQRRKQ